jgi:hypothetical protein
MEEAQKKKKHPERTSVSSNDNETITTAEKV